MYIFVYASWKGSFILKYIIPPLCFLFFFHYFWNKLKLNHLVSKTNTFSFILHLLKFLEHVHKFSLVFRSTQMGACLKIWDKLGYVHVYNNILQFIKTVYCNVFIFIYCSFFVTL